MKVMLDSQEAVEPKPGSNVHMPVLQQQGDQGRGATREVSEAQHSGTLNPGSCRTNQVPSPLPPVHPPGLQLANVHKLVTVAIQQNWELHSGAVGHV